MGRIAAAAVLLLVQCVATFAFYLPGVAPKTFHYGEKVDLKVNKLTSSKTQLPYDYYALPFCKPDKIEYAAENLGEILTGNSIENSPYEISFLKEETCKLLCRRVSRVGSSNCLGLFILWTSEVAYTLSEHCGDVMMNNVCNG